MTEYTTISLTREQKEKLNDAKERLYRSDSVPHGEAIADLCEFHDSITSSHRVDSNDSQTPNIS